MRFDKMLEELYTERELLDEAIRSLEAMLAEATQKKPRRRGRYSMPPEERREVSRRMKAYWAARRKQ